MELEISDWMAREGENGDDEREEAVAEDLLREKEEEAEQIAGRAKSDR